MVEAIQHAADTPAAKIVALLENESDMKRGCRRLSDVLHSEIILYNVDQDPIEKIATSPFQAPIFHHPISIVIQNALPGIFYCEPCTSCFRGLP